MTIQRVYSTFKDAKNVIINIEPIDYFFATELSQNIEPNHLTTYFHLLVALSESVRKGHTCLPIAKLANHTMGASSDKEGLITHHGFTFPPLNEMETILTNLNISTEANKPVIFASTALYMRRYFSLESELSHQFSQRVYAKPNAENTPKLEQLKNIINELFKTSEIDEHSSEIDWQKVAVVNSLNKSFSVIAGGPGTGKTYTVTKLLAAVIKIYQLEVKTPIIKLVAPTGKAAQRLSESIINAVNGFKDQIDENILSLIPQDAQTIHRLLGVIPNTTQFKHNEDSPIDCDLLIIDEVSMVDLPLMTRTFRALPANCRVVLLGDADQLPSVELGSVLADIAPRPHAGYSEENSNYLKSIIPNLALKPTKRNASDYLTYLVKSRRFDGEGNIGKIAKFVIEGNAKDSWNVLINAKKKEGEEADVFLLNNVEDQIPSKVQLNHPKYKSWLESLVSQYYRPLLTENDLQKAFLRLSEFRILCATRQGEQGVETFNKQIIEMLGKQLSAEPLFHGLPIMISENNYRLDLYNGDIGIIWKNDKGNLTAIFECPHEGFLSIIPSRLPTYEPVFAMTIHKTQGSEFKHVAMVLPKKSDNRLLSRELIYTGITRAKERLSIESSIGTWSSGVEAKIKRDSTLTISKMNTI